MTSHSIDTARTSVLSSVRGRVAEAAQLVSEWRSKRAYRARISRELETYTDRELFDLGISRANFPEILDGSFRR
jgi:uncharacterized protein YjiS (DUF1127 family)